MAWYLKSILTKSKELVAFWMSLNVARKSSISSDSHETPLDGSAQLFVGCRTAVLTCFCDILSSSLLYLASMPWEIPATHVSSSTDTWKHMTQAIIWYPTRFRCSIAVIPTCSDKPSRSSNCGRCGDHEKQAPIFCPNSQRMDIRINLVFIHTVSIFTGCGCNCWIAPRLGDVYLAPVCAAGSGQQPRQVNGRRRLKLRSLTRNTAPT